MLVQGSMYQLGPPSALQLCFQSMSVEICTLGLALSFAEVVAFLVLEVGSLNLKSGHRDAPPYILYALRLGFILLLDKAPRKTHIVASACGTLLGQKSEDRGTGSKRRRRTIGVLKNRSFHLGSCIRVLHSASAEAVQI